MKKAGFTLIELIVVITILAILGTIAFIGFKGYTSDARNSKITTDIANLHNVLAILKASEGTIPMPDSSVTVKSGTTDITYEGEVGDNVRNTLKASSDAKTPTGENYKYAVNGTQKDFTLVGELENETAGITTNAFAEGEADTMLFKGDEVLTLFDGSNNFVGGTIDNGSLPDGTVAFIGEKEMTISGKSVEKLPQSIKENRGVIFNSCKEILDGGFSNGDGTYKVNLNQKNANVYCDMTTNGGGWTLVVSQLDGITQYPGSISSFTYPINENNPSVESAYGRNWEADKVVPTKLMIKDPVNNQFVSANVTKWCGWGGVTNPTTCGITGATNYHGTFAELSNTSLNDELYFSTCALAGGCYTSGSEGWAFSSQAERPYAGGKNKAWGYSWWGDTSSTTRFAGGYWGTTPLSTGQATHMLLFYQ